MQFSPSFDDEILGRVTWNLQDKCWNFDAGPVDGRSVPASYIPEDETLPPADQGWDRLRACVVWVRANERAVRAYLMQKVDKGNAPIAGDILSLSGINFHKNQEPRLIYQGFRDAVSVQVNAAGELVTDPIWLVSG